MNIYVGTSCRRHLISLCALCGHVFAISLRNFSKFLTALNFKFNNNWKQTKC